MVTGAGEQFRQLAGVLRESAPGGMRPVEVIPIDVDAAESELGVRFPQGYRSFLTTFGYADWPAIIYGVGNRGLPGDKVAIVAQRERLDMVPAIPHYLVPFSPDGAGNHYCLDTSRLSDGECPVVFWDHEGSADQVPNIVSATFLDWLASAIAAEFAPDQRNACPSIMPEGPVVGIAGDKLGYRPSRCGTPPYDTEGFRIELHADCNALGIRVIEVSQREHRGQNAKRT